MATLRSLLGAMRTSGFRSPSSVGACPLRSLLGAMRTGQVGHLPGGVGHLLRSLLGAMRTTGRYAFLPVDVALRSLLGAMRTPHARPGAGDGSGVAIPARGDEDPSRTT